MEQMTADILRRLNKGFYRDNSASFSATRNNAWPGWERCLAAVGEAASAPGYSVVDVACGNMRFHSYLRDACGMEKHVYTGVDSCVLFQGPLPEGVRFVRADLLEEMEESTPLLEQLFDSESFDLCACFGFMHHVPTPAQRVRLVSQMLRLAVPGGHVALSLWRFAENEELARKARESTALAREHLQLPALGKGDYLLGWQGMEGTYRYCHSFTREETDELVDAVWAQAQLVERFESDGRDGALNTYLVWRVR